MEASTLRWIIIVIGIIILAAIFLFGNPERQRKPKASRRKPLADYDRLEPALEPTADATPAAEGEHPPGQGELPILTSAEVVNIPARPRPPRKPAGPPPDKIVTLFLMARDNHRVAGAELLQATVKTGMAFGDMNIFHRVADGSDQPVFSMANALAPGAFDKDAWNTFETDGVALFLTLPGPLLALDAWDAMLANARRIAELLRAEIRDSAHQPFTRQKEAGIREEMRAWDRDQARKALL